ncbi:hypothetical protein NDU88_002306 [Pleurodeles waltl]|uniref:Uncharacterized protein n=1 Tax=Pleurodeles waltl TaxID=8319 RepID=A0AAV7MSD9_PLEWA|nr:hypothetical protein NDU88_002306 [Pleurodeles waltl]
MRKKGGEDRDAQGAKDQQRLWSRKRNVERRREKPKHRQPRRFPNKNRHGSSSYATEFIYKQVHTYIN